MRGEAGTEKSGAGALLALAIAAVVADDGYASGGGGSAKGEASDKEGRAGVFPAPRHGRGEGMTGTAKQGPGALLALVLASAVAAVVLALLAMAPADAASRHKTVTRTFSNAAFVGIPGDNAMDPPFAASPYPSEIAVGGLERGKVLDVNVTLRGFGHTWPEDVDAMVSHGATSLLRASALAALLGGLLWAAKVIYESGNDRAYPEDPTDALLFVVPLLLLAGLAGLYVHCRGRLGELEKLSLAGFVLGSVGLAGASVSSGLWALGVVSDLLGGLWGGLLFVAVGLMLLGGSIFANGLLGRWKAAPLVIGFVSLLAVALPPWNVFGVAVWALFGLAWVVLGCVLWLGEDKTVQPAMHAR